MRNLSSRDVCIHCFPAIECDECAPRLDLPSSLERAAWLVRNGRMVDAARIVMGHAEAIERAADPIEAIVIRSRRFPRDP